MGRFLKRRKEKRAEKKSGEGAYIRIQNKSSLSVTIKISDASNVDMDTFKNVQGAIGPNKQLPASGSNATSKYGGEYTYIEGEVYNRFQKDGHLTIEAHPAGDKAPPSTLELIVDHDSWETRDTTPDESSKVIMVCDVEEEDDEDWKIELRIYDSFQGHKWMGDMEDCLADKRLVDVGLPGTHDSGTYKFDKDKGASPDSDLTSTIQDKLDHGRLLGKMTDMILNTVFVRLCQCQDKSFKEQLEAGIRYFDLRVAYHKESKSYYTCHGVYCVNMKDALQEIGDFLKANSKEIVILEFKKLFEMEEEQHEELLNMVMDTLGEERVADKDDIKPHSTVQEYWAKGFQAIVLYKQRSVLSKYEGKVWPIRWIGSKWPNTGDPKVLRERLMTAIEERNTNQFFVVQGILTPDTELIKSELMNGAGVSIKDFSDKCSSKVVGWVEEDWKPKKCLNIVIVDFFENCSLLPAIINYNRC